jgi:hypothetical protein
MAPHGEHCSAFYSKPCLILKADIVQEVDTISNVVLRLMAVRFSSALSDAVRTKGFVTLRVPVSAPVARSG